MICVGSGADLATGAAGRQTWRSGTRCVRGDWRAPPRCGQDRDDWWPVLNKLAQSPRVVAVGETGLDYFYDHSPRDKQAEVFKAIPGAQPVGAEAFCLPRARCPRGCAHHSARGGG